MWQCVTEKRSAAADLSGRAVVFPMLWDRKHITIMTSHAPTALQHLTLTGSVPPLGVAAAAADWPLTRLASSPPRELSSEPQCACSHNHNNFHMIMTLIIWKESFPLKPLVTQITFVCRQTQSLSMYTCTGISAHLQRCCSSSCLRALSSRSASRCLSSARSCLSTLFWAKASKSGSYRHRQHSFKGSLTHNWRLVIINSRSCCSEPWSDTRMRKWQFLFFVFPLKLWWNRTNLHIFIHNVTYIRV